MDIKDFDWSKILPPKMPVGQTFKTLDPPVVNVGQMMRELNEEQIEAVNGIKDFLVAQSEAANKQFRASLLLVGISIIGMLIQIVIALADSSLIKGDEDPLAPLVEIQAQQSENLSKMTLELIALQKQVKLLEDENEELRGQNLKK